MYSICITEMIIKQACSI